MNLVDRIKGIPLQPKSEWSKIESEPGDAGYLLSNYVAILAAIPPICTFIGASIIGIGGYRVGIGMELVRRGDGPDQVAAERPAELRDVGLEHLRCRGRRPAGPDLLDQAIARDRLVRPKKEDDEQRAGLARTQRHDAAV